MTPEEYKQKADDCLRDAQRCLDGNPRQKTSLAFAQVYATLALYREPFQDDFGL